MSEVKIDKNVPIPPARENPNSITSALMELALSDIGDSVQIATTKPNSVRTIAVKVGKDTGCSFITRATGNSIRVWRVA